MLVRRLCLALALVAPAAGQKLARAPLEDPVNGLRVTLPEWPGRVLPAGVERLGILYDFGECDPLHPFEGEHAVVARLPEIRAADASDELADTIAEIVGGLLLEPHHEGEWLEPVIDEVARLGEQPARRLRLRWKDRWLERSLWVDAYSVSAEDQRLALVYTMVGAKPRPSWVRAVEKSARSLTLLPRRAGVTQVDYESVLALQRAKIAHIPGWRVLPTPSQKFVILTSHDDQRFVEQVIERLELSRELFERDFPPPAGFRAVSVVRICSSSIEFHTYGGTDARSGVMGWFSPETTEMVLYDAQDVDRRMSFAVMTHEAFHQYCYYLFDRAQAPRWFDEGHGDYYGAFQWSPRGKPEVRTQMPGGLDRLREIQLDVQSGGYGPLDQHLLAGPELWPVLGGYAQSWSIVYMLRQGMLGQVHKKVWREEYASILPRYVGALRDGFAQACAELLLQARRQAAEEDREPTAEELDVHGDDVPEERVAAIWEAAYDASWGTIDRARFEQDWKLFVEKHLH